MIFCHPVTTQRAKLSVQFLSRGHILSLIFGFSDAVKCTVYYQAWEKDAILKLILCEKKNKEK